MIIGYLQRGIRSLVSPASQFKMACLLVGALTGILLWAWYTQFIALLGSSSAVSGAVVLAAAIAVGIGIRMQTGPTGEPRTWIVAGVLLFAAATWTWAFPYLVGRVAWAAHRVGPSLMDSSAVAFLFTFCAALFALGMPCLALAKTWSILAHAAGIDAESNEQGNQARFNGWSRIPLAWQIAGVSIGLLLAGSGFGPWLGIQSTAMIAAVLGGIAGFYCLWQTTQPQHTTIEVNRRQKSEDSPAVAPQIVRLATWTVAAAFGVLIANSLRMTAQLFIISAELQNLAFSGMAIGMAIGIAAGAWLLRRKTDPLTLWVRGSLFVAVWIVCLTALFPIFTKWSLVLNAYESSRLLLTAGRCGITLFYFLPMGLVWGFLAVSTISASRLPLTHAVTRMGLVPAALGYCCYRWFDLATFGPTAVVLGSAILIWLAAGLLAGLGRQLHKGWMHWGAVAASFVVIAASSTWMDRYDPIRTARTLFSTDVFMAYRSKFDANELNQYDDARFHTLKEGSRGTYTIWKRRGSQWQIRQDGLSGIVAATDVDIHPQFSAELLPGVVPFVLHENPRKTLFLGLGSGVSLAGSLHFPVMDVVCLEADPGYLELMKNEILPEMVDNPLLDERVRIRRADPALAALAGRQLYDVIVSEPGFSMQAQNTAYFTVEFYQNLAAQLAEGGIFAQRFRFIDYGAEPLRIVAQTLQKAFDHVMLLQAANGEMLLLGTNSPAGLIRPGLLERVSRSHVQSALANCGWDWSIVLNLSIHSGDQLTEFVKQGPLQINSATNGYFRNYLPREVVRWANKQQEVANALVPHTGRLLSLMSEEEAANPEILEHLEEVTGRQRLIHDYPDQYWAYRASVREEVTQGAENRSIIQQVKHQLAGHDFHPRDQRRMNYFKALSEAQKTKSPEDISRVSHFARPFDPLLTYFLHGEVAELYFRAGENRDVEQELRHRLYTTYYTVAGDRSVQNVVAALNLLNEHPEAVADPQARYDHINGLLQVLQTRWYARGSVEPNSFSVMISDVSETLKTANQSFKTMQELSVAAGLQPQDWEQRERVLNRTLVKPLRDYRTQLQAQYKRAKMTSQAIRNQAAQNSGQQ